MHEKKSLHGNPDPAKSIRYVPDCARRRIFHAGTHPRVAVANGANLRRKRYGTSHHHKTGMNLTQVFVHLSEDGGARSLAAGAELLNQAKQGKERQQGHVLGALHASAGSSHWERHPDGD
ncbi:MAG: hypothetical protein M0Q87_14415 [Ottowia sp.]|nr:hypothetical protein [Ottowia sp.]